MIFIGIDPDLHCCGIATIDDKGKVTRCLTVKTPKKLFKGRDAVVAMIESLQVAQFYEMDTDHVLCVEAQEIYLGQTKNPRSIMLLATVAGAALALPASKRYFPAPQEWKGSVPKQIHQARTLGVTP